MKNSLPEKVLRKLVKHYAGLYYSILNPAKSREKTITSAGKVLDKTDLFAMIDASLDMWLTTGRFNQALEKRLCEFFGMNFALTVNSGSSANLLALSALMSYKLGEKRLKQGDEVITTACCFPTTAAPIVQNGLVPVFIDVELGKYNINVELIEKAITKKTRAIFLSHNMGNPFEVEKVIDLCNKYHLWFIEDNADAIGACYKGKLTGKFGHISTFSFYPSHQITSGEGGAVMTNDELLYRILLSYRDWGRDCWCPTGKTNICKNRFGFNMALLPFGYDHKYIYSHLGYNMKMTDWQASIALSQIDKLKDFIEKRKDNFNLLYKGLSKYLDYFILPYATPESTPCWFGFVVTISPTAPFNRLDIIKHLEDSNIEARHLYAGNILRQPAFVENNFKIRVFDHFAVNSSEIDEKILNLLPNTDIIMNNTFWTGLWPGITEKQIKRVLESFDRFFALRT